jgi:hypothetical protein
MIDINLLREWLGPEGARSGLRDSDIPLKELIDLAKDQRLPLSPKPTRDEVVNELAYQKISKIDKSLEEMQNMTPGDLIAYLEKKKPTTSEVLSILTRLGIRPGSEDRKHLLRFAAREITEIGMFQRIAHGSAVTASRNP